MISKSGSFIGNGVNNRSITGLGFQPDLVMIKAGNDSNADTWFRTKDMPANFSLPVRSDNAGDTNHILSLNGDGFTVSADNAVNQSTYTMYYLALKEDSDDDFRTVSFTGDDTDLRAVFTSWLPRYALLKTASGITGVTKHSAQGSSTSEASNASMPTFQGATARSDTVGFRSGTMTVSNGSNSGANLVNRSGIITYGFVLRDATTNVRYGNFIGNATTPRQITTGNTPIWVNMFPVSPNTENSYPIVAYKDGAAAGKASFWDSSPTNMINSFDSNGFTIGSTDFGNKSSISYGWVAIAEKAPPAVAPTSDFTATPVNAYVGQPVQFTDTSTGNPTSWSWGFGDTTTSTLQNPSKTYTAAGTYTVTLTTSNNAGTGTTQTKTNYITVSPAPSEVLLVSSATFPDDLGYVQSASVTMNVTAGNFLIMALAAGPAEADFGGITDNLGNTWIKMSGAQNSKGVTVWYVKSAIGGSTTVTVTGNAGGYLDFSGALRQYSSVDSVNPIVDFSLVNDPAYLNTLHATNTPRSVGNKLVFFSVLNNTAGTATIYNNSLTATTVNSNGLYSRTYSGDAPYSTATATTAGYDYTEYVQSTNYLIELKYVNEVVPVRPAPPGVTNVVDWYPYGVPAVSNRTTRLNYLANAWNIFKNYTFTQTGMKTGMPTGAWRVAVPDQVDPVAGTSGGTFSEGIGYGMIAAVYMGMPTNPVRDSNAKTYFDGFWKYYNYYKNANGLMNWRISAAGDVTGQNGATDGDVDVAYALIMAHRVWGSAGEINYQQAATSLLNAIIQYEFYPANHSNAALRNTMINGDGWDTAQSGSPDWIMPDYFAPAFYNVFADFTGNSRWLDIKAANYPLMSDQWDNAYTTGFVPDQSTRAGAQVMVDGAKSYIYGYNSIRRWRHVLDYLWYGGTDYNSAYYLNKKMADFQQTFSNSIPANTRAEWNLQGTASATYTNVAFNQSYAASSLVSPENTAFGNALYQWIDTNNSSAAGYFGTGLATMSALVASGLFVPTYNIAYSAKVQPAPNGFFFA